MISVCVDYARKRLLSCGWMGWDWLVLIHFWPSLLQKRLAAAILALRRNVYFCLCCFFLHSVCLKCCRLPSVMCCDIVLMILKHTACRGILGLEIFLNDVGDCSRWRSQSWRSVCPYRVKQNILVAVFDFPLGETTIVVSFWNSSEPVRCKCGW